MSKIITRIYKWGSYIQLYFDMQCLMFDLYEQQKNVRLSALTKKDTMLKNYIFLLRWPFCITYIYGVYLVRGYGDSVAVIGVENGVFKSRPKMFRSFSK